MNESNQTVPQPHLKRGNYRANQSFLSEHLDELRDSRGLEVGCGYGFLTDWLREQNCSMTGLEVNSERLAHARSKFPGPNWVFGDACLLPFESGAFDFVVSFDVLEHLPDVEAHVQDVRRALRPGGAYYLGTPNKLTNIPYEIWKEKSFTRYRDYHVSLQTAGSLKRLFRSHGFEIELADVELMTPYFHRKLRRDFGWLGSLMGYTPLDRLPRSLRTNFYAVARIQ